MHAYLILAHNQFDLLQKLVCLLDDKRNDIFIHIDAKVNNFDFNNIKKCTKFSNVYFTDRRYSISWGSFKMVKAEYALLEKALDNGRCYDYVHLISGADLPIKSQDEIHSFFLKNNGKEFVHFTHEHLNYIELDRVRTYHFAVGRRNIFNRFITKAESILGRIFGINRIKNLSVQKGSQWFSITGDFAKFVLTQKSFVYKQFNHTFIPDEFFIQTLLINSRFSDNLYHKKFDDSPYGNMHYSDWKRGTPYTFTYSDKDEIDNMDFMFVRKFDLNRDRKIVEYILSKRGIEL